MDMLAALLPQPGPAFLTAVFLLLAALLTYLGFYRRLNPPLRWLLAIGLGAGFAAVLYAWPDEAPLGAAVLATATFTVFIVATAACFAPKQQATTSVASGKEKSHG
jgi:hypothetical protein